MTHSMWKGRIRTLWGGLLSLVTAVAAAAEGVEFNRDIKPILGEHCLQCHGPDKAEGGLNLTNAGRRWPNWTADGKPSFPAGRTTANWSAASPPWTPTNGCHRKRHL